MKIKDRIIGEAAKAAYLTLRLIVLNLSDQSMARLMRALERTTYALTRDRKIKSVLAEMADVFETGPPFTDTVRKMLKTKETSTAASAARCLFRKSPYGAP